MVVNSQAGYGIVTCVSDAVTGTDLIIPLIFQSTFWWLADECGWIYIPTKTAFLHSNVWNVRIKQLPWVEMYLTVQNTTVTVRYIPPV